MAMDAENIVSKFFRLLTSSFNATSCHSKVKGFVFVCYRKQTKVSSSITFKILNDRRKITGGHGKKANLEGWLAGFITQHIYIAL